MSRNILFIMVSLSLLLSMHCAYAQKHTIKGIVEDDEGSFVERAAIQLFGNDSTLIAGAVTNDKGRFVIEDISPGGYKMAISHLGYKTGNITLPDIRKSTNIGVVTLSSTAVELDGVVIEAKEEIHKYDKILIYPSRDHKKYAANGYGLLNNIMIPTLFVNMTSNIVTSPLGKVSFYLDGREVERKEILALPPNRVLRIEYQDSPGGEFPGKDVVVNFITIKQESGGYTALSIDQKPISGEYMATGKFHHKNSEFSLIYSPSYINDKNVYSKIEEVFQYPEDRVVRDWEGIPSRYKEDSHQLNLNYFYRTDKQDFNIALDYWQYNNPMNRMSGSRIYSGMYNEIYETTMSNSTKTKEPSIDINYDLRINPKHRLKLNLYTDCTNDKYNYIYTEKKEQESESVTLNREMDSRFFFANLYYEYTLDPSNIIQAQTIYRRQDADFRYLNGFDYKENQVYDKYLFRLYYTRKWKRFSSTVLGGLSRYLYNSDKEEKNDEFNKEVLLFLRYASKKNNVLNYKLQLTTANPALEQLSSVEQPVDFMQSSRGNPYLKNETRFLQQVAYWLTVNKIRFYFCLQQNSIFNAAQNDVFIEDGKFIHSYTSDNDLHSIKALATTVNSFFNKRLTMRISGNFTRYWINGTSDRQLNTWYVEANANYKYKEWLISAYAKSVENSLGRDGVHYRSGSIHGLSVSYTKEGFLVSVGTENPFYKNHTDNRFRSAIYEKNTKTFDRRSSKVFFVRVAWNFGFGGKYKYSEIDLRKSKDGVHEPF